MDGVRVIVAMSIKHGEGRARLEGLPLHGPGAVRIISTSSDGRAARGMRLQRDEVIWDRDWYLGPNAKAVEAALAPCFVA